MCDNIEVAEGAVWEGSLTSDEIDWWHQHFAPSDMSIRNVVDKLVEGMPGQKDGNVTRLDTVEDVFSVEIESNDSAGQVFLTSRTIEFQVNKLNLDFSLIRPDYQAKGFGRRLAANCYRLARELQLEMLSVTAVDTGAYVWAKVGFLPSYETWNDLKCKGRIKQRLEDLKGLGDRERQPIIDTLDDDAPENLWIIADLDVVLEENKNFNRFRTLGKELIIGSQCSWKGTIKFDDHDLMDEQSARIRHYLKLGCEG